MILLRLLEHDLHRSRNLDASPLWIETPSKPSHLPAVISGSGMDIPERRFLIARKLTKDGLLRSGTFKYDSDRVDEVIGHMMHSAYNLSVSENWPNVFRGKDQLKRAFGYIQKSIGLASQPHLCLLPEESDTLAAFTKAAGKDFVDRVYRKVCSTTPSKVAFPVFCSRPDFVGMYTQLVGGRSSILLHNVKNGLAFCPPD